MNVDISLPKFQVHYHNDCYYSSCIPIISRCLKFAMKKKVKDLHLYVNNYIHFSFPDVLPHVAYCNSSLIHLSLHNFKLVPEGGMSWTSLKSLSLHYVTLGDDTVEKILVGRPVLEILKLNSCCFPSAQTARVVDVKSEVLKELAISLHSDFLEISAPNLKYLDIAGQFNHLRLRNVSSLSRATLGFSLTIFEDEDQDPHSAICCCVHELFQTIRHVVQLQVSCWLVRVLSMLEVKGFLASLECLKDLTLFSELHQLDLPGILFLLKGSPNIEKLLMHCHPHPYNLARFPLDVSMREQLIEYSSKQNGPIKSKDELSLLFKNACAGLTPSFPHLKSVKMIELDVTSLCSITRLIQFLLYNAQVLELVALSMAEHLKKSYSSRLSRRFTQSRRWFPHTKILVH